MKYDRQLLLHGPKRNEILQLDEIQAYGRDSYGDTDYVSIYGLRPAEWFAKGIRLLGRTAVECTRDELADQIGKDVAAVARAMDPQGRPYLLDPFAGSGNTLYWLARHLCVEQGIGFELDPVAFALTKSNLATLDLPVEVRNIDFNEALGALKPAAGRLIVAFVAPPWGDALDPVFGLDLRRTYPPVSQITGRIKQHFANNPLLLAIQVYEKINEESLRELAATCDWHELRVYDLLSPGSNQGILIVTHGWSPT